MTEMKRVDLTVLGQPPSERADAARSRRVLLAAARVILAEKGIAGLSMDCLATRAGVGVGTVYRRFTDRSGLALALLDSEEQRFQAGFISGPPPLGPGAPPLDRVWAFFCAYVDRLELEADIHALAESRDPTTFYRSGVYQTHRSHLRTLLAQTDTPLEPDQLAESLLALMSGALYIHQRRERGLSVEQIKANLKRLLEQLVGRYIR